MGLFSNAFYIFDSAPIDGNQSPGKIRIDNLGVVTVHADGSEEYDGPLKKVK